jgi:RNAse (barnase) inhibitor barstar
VLDAMVQTAVQNASKTMVRYRGALETADRVQITNEHERESWSAFHADLTEAFKLVDQERKDAAAPWDRVTKSINAAYRTTLDALDSAKRLVGNRLAVFIAEERSRQEKELEDQRERERLAAKHAQESGQQIVVRPKAAEVPVQSAVRTSAGTTSTRENWDCEVTNLEIIPREFLVFDKQLVVAKCRSMEKSVGAPREDAFAGLRVFKAVSVASSKRVL